MSIFERGAIPHTATHISLEITSRLCHAVHGPIRPSMAAVDGLPLINIYIIKTRVLCVFVSPDSIKVMGE